MSDKDRFIAEFRILLARHKVVLENAVSTGDCNHPRIYFDHGDWWIKAEDLIPDLGPCGRVTG